MINIYECKSDWWVSYLFFDNKRTMLVLMHRNNISWAYVWRTCSILMQDSRYVTPINLIRAKINKSEIGLFSHIPAEITTLETVRDV